MTKRKKDLTKIRYEAILEAIDVWETRERRAINRLRKLRDAKTRYETRRPDLIRSVLLAKLKPTKVATPGNGVAAT